MKFCTPHWDQLRAAIKERGLDGLVAKDGEQAVAKLTDQLEKNDTTKTNFDPLMAAHNAITGRVLEIVGLNLLLPNEDGSERCPLCFAQVCHDAECKHPGCAIQIANDWIPSCCDAMREEAVRLGLVASS